MTFANVYMHRTLFAALAVATHCIVPALSSSLLRIAEQFTMRITYFCITSKGNSMSFAQFSEISFKHEDKDADVRRTRV